MHDRPHISDLAKLDFEEALREARRRDQEDYFAGKSRPRSEREVIRKLSFTFRDRIRRSDGQATVEVALLAPVIIAACAFFGSSALAIIGAGQLSQATRDGATAAAAGLDWRAEAAASKTFLRDPQFSISATPTPVGVRYQVCGSSAWKVTALFIGIREGRSTSCSAELGPRPEVGPVS